MQIANSPPRRSLCRPAEGPRRLRHQSLGQSTLASSDRSVTSQRIPSILFFPAPTVLYSLRYCSPCRRCCRPRPPCLASCSPFRRRAPRLPSRRMVSRAPLPPCSLGLTAAYRLSVNRRATMEVPPSHRVRSSQHHICSRMVRTTTTTIITSLSSPWLPLLAAHTLTRPGFATLHWGAAVPTPSNQPLIWIIHPGAITPNTMPTSIRHSSRPIALTGRTTCRCRRTGSHTGGPLLDPRLRPPHLSSLSIPRCRRRLLSRVLCRLLLRGRLPLSLKGPRGSQNVRETSGRLVYHPFSPLPRHASLFVQSHRIPPPSRALSMRIV